MIQNFPNFKPLELSDKKEIELFTAQYDPYSDFNFASTWSWGHKFDAKIAFLNRNLVLYFTNQDTQQPIFSFLGNNAVTETCDSIFNYLENLGHKNGIIGWMPEVSLNGLNFNKYYIDIELDACDYIYDLTELSSLHGNKYSSKRRKVNHFILHYQDARVVVKDQIDDEIKKDISVLNDLWISRKEDNHDLLVGEMKAMERFFDANFDNIFCVAIYTDKLIGYGIFSSAGPDYVFNHFMKGDTSYIGIYEFIMRESSSYLKSKGFKYMNSLEDLGLPGLREFKSQYQPTEFLKKYRINKL